MNTSTDSQAAVAASARPKSLTSVAGSVSVTGLIKNYGAFEAVKSIDFSVAPGETISLLGPSGCGKTTTLRCLAGLEVPNGGSIRIGDQTVFDHDARIFVAPEHRNIGMVFQSYAIWPHMTVDGNVGFPMRIAKFPKEETNRRIDEVLALLGLSELRYRSAAALSGGQQQRVALARALVHRPKVVLFDEPLSNLDAGLREHVRTELRQLQDELKFTAIFVTHDQSEALALSDRIILVNKGIIEQEGTPREVFNEPATQFAAEFLGYTASMAGTVAEAAPEDCVIVDVADSVSVKARWREESQPQSGQRAIISVRPEAIKLGAVGTLSGENCFEVDVVSSIFLGTETEYLVRLGQMELKVVAPAEVILPRGSRAAMRLPVEECHVFASRG